MDIACRPLITATIGTPSNSSCVSAFRSTYLPETVFQVPTGSSPTDFGYWVKVRLTLEMIEPFITPIREFHVQMGLDERLALALLTSMFLITLFCLPQTLSSLRDLSHAVSYSALAALTGLFIKISAAILGIKKPSEQGEMLEEFIGKMLVRRSRFQTFTRICLWNILVSFVIVAAGFFTIGVLPVVWAFLNLGLFSPEIDIFKRYLHSWLETVAFILSASLGIWGGVNLNTVLVDFGTIPPSIIILILGLHTLAAMLETLEIHVSEHSSA